MHVNKCQGCMQSCMEYQGQLARGGEGQWPWFHTAGAPLWISSLAPDLPSRPTPPSLPSLMPSCTLLSPLCS